MKFLLLFVLLQMCMTFFLLRVLSSHYKEETEAKQFWKDLRVSK